MPATPTQWIRSTRRPKSIGRSTDLMAEKSAARVDASRCRHLHPIARGRAARDFLEIAQHEIERVRPVHALQVAPKFAEQPVVENGVEHLGLQLAELRLGDDDAASLS